MVDPCKPNLPHKRSRTSLKIKKKAVKSMVEKRINLWVGDSKGLLFPITWISQLIIFTNKSWSIKIIIDALLQACYTPIWVSQEFKGTEDNNRSNPFCNRIGEDVKETGLRSVTDFVVYVLRAIKSEDSSKNLNELEVDSVRQSLITRRHV